MAVDKLIQYRKVRRRIGGYAGSFTKKLRASLISRNNISTKELLNTISGRIENKGNYVGFIVSMKGYGNFLNKNIHPRRMPSIDAILAWMKRKNIQPRRGKDGRFTSRRKVAYAIAKAIQKDGFSNFNPVSDFYKGNLGWLDVVWEEEKSRLRKDSRKDLVQAVRNISQESLSFTRPTEVEGQSVNQTFF